MKTDTIYKEIVELHLFALNLGIKSKLEPLFEGYKLSFEDGTDFIQHKYSYGSEIGCVEPAMDCPYDYSPVDIDTGKKIIKERFFVDAKKEKNKKHTAK